MSFTKINIDFTEVKSFWELNPHMEYLPPYAKYKQEVGDEESSNGMWVVALSNEPDEDENPYYKIGKKRIEELVRQHFGDFDSDNELFLECDAAYPEDCLPEVLKSLRDYHIFLKNRSNYLKGLSKKEYIENMKDVDTAASKTLRLYQEYEEAESLFKLEKAKAQVKGGRNESKAERGLI